MNIKKCLALLITLLVSFITINVNAEECTTDIINGANNINVTYDYIYDEETDTNKFYFIFENMTEDYYAEITSEKLIQNLIVELTDNKYEIENYYINSLRGNTAVVNIYSKCQKSPLLSKSISVPILNYYYSTCICEGIEDYNYCNNKYLNEDISATDLYYNILNYKKSMNLYEEGTSNFVPLNDSVFSSTEEKQNNNFNIYLLFFILLLIIAIFIVVLLRKKHFRIKKGNLSIFLIILFCILTFPNYAKANDISSVRESVDDSLKVHYLDKIKDKSINAYDVYGISKYNNNYAFCHWPAAHNATELSEERLAALSECTDSSTISLYCQLINIYQHMLPSNGYQSTGYYSGLNEEWDKYQATVLASRFYLFSYRVGGKFVFNPLVAILGGEDRAYGTDLSKYTENIHRNTYMAYYNLRSEFDGAIPDLLKSMIGISAIGANFSVSRFNSTILGSIVDEPFISFDGASESGKNMLGAALETVYQVNNKSDLWKVPNKSVESVSVSGNTITVTLNSGYDLQKFTSIKNIEAKVGEKKLKTSKTKIDYNSKNKKTQFSFKITSNDNLCNKQSVKISFDIEDVRNLILYNLIGTKSNKEGAIQNYFTYDYDWVPYSTSKEVTIPCDNPDKLCKDQSYDGKKVSNNAILTVGNMKYKRVSDYETKVYTSNVLNTCYTPFTCADASTEGKMVASNSFIDLTNSYGNKYKYFRKSNYKNIQINTSKSVISQCYDITCDNYFHHDTAIKNSNGTLLKNGYIRANKTISYNNKEYILKDSIESIKISTTSDKNIIDYCYKSITCADAKINNKSILDAGMEIQTNTDANGKVYYIRKSKDMLSKTYLKANEINNAKNILAACYRTPSTCYDYATINNMNTLTPFDKNGVSYVIDDNKKNTKLTCNPVTEDCILKSCYQYQATCATAVQNLSSEYDFQLIDGITYLNYKEDVYFATNNYASTRIWVPSDITNARLFNTVKGACFSTCADGFSESDYQKAIKVNRGDAYLRTCNCDDEEFKKTDHFKLVCSCQGTPACELANSCDDNSKKNVGYVTDNVTLNLCVNSISGTENKDKYVKSDNNPYCDVACKEEIPNISDYFVYSKPINDGASLKFKYNDYIDQRISLSTVKTCVSSVIDYAKAKDDYAKSTTDSAKASIKNQVKECLTLDNYKDNEKNPEIDFDYMIDETCKYVGKSTYGSKGFKVSSSEVNTNNRYCAQYNTDTMECIKYVDNNDMNSYVDYVFNTGSNPTILFGEKIITKSLKYTPATEFYSDIISSNISTKKASLSYISIGNIFPLPIKYEVGKSYYYKYIIKKFNFENINDTVILGKDACNNEFICDYKRVKLVCTPIIEVDVEVCDPACIGDDCFDNDESINYVYNTVSTTTMFDGINSYGSNWQTDKGKETASAIKDLGDDTYSEENLDFSITITPEVARSIKNSTTGDTYIDNDGVSCITDDSTGLWYCTSKFIKGLNETTKKINESNVSYQGTKEYNGKSYITYSVWKGR